MKVDIVGAGMVGGTAAYAMVMSGVGRVVVLVDARGERAEAQADDISHAVPFSNPLNIHAGDYADLAGSRAGHCGRGWPPTRRDATATASA